MSTRRNKIVLSGEPRGYAYEGVLKTATAKPGQCVKITGGTVEGGDSDDVFADGGEVHELQYSPGFAGAVTLITEKNLLGFDDATAYAVDDGIHVYNPLPGEDFRALGLSGETLNVGTRANFDADGKLVAAAAGIITVLEAGGTLSADTLLICRLSGSSVATAS